MEKHVMSVVERLLKSDEPSIRYKTLLYILGEKKDSAKVRHLQREIKNSDRTSGLLSGRDDHGRLPYHPYTKWYGAHWTLVGLADLDYPPGDKELMPLRDQVYDWLLSREHEKNIRLIKGLTRRCGSQEGNALYTSLYLGIADKRADELARRLAMWQWPDGGWNCDKEPDAKISSYRETIVPFRALALHAKLTGNAESKKAAGRAAELLLKRKLFKKLKDGTIMRESFVELHYPRYFEYDILFGLLILAEAGYLKDKRCKEALDLLESKRLPDGGWPCERNIYKTGLPGQGSRISLIDWGGSGSTRLNEFVTVDAFRVLKEAG
ncbi:MAG: hypothetical protein AB1746_14145, partial [Candidatus Zixiibacteriota bacterium]